jgi:GalNAc-alpha-(1->4)-GalNAc-alpha-(1->3)-diNAcBac-PP-undecaprenol alpha-1,4-N-acetyl-D-galactosaminyltransferase
MKITLVIYGLKRGGAERIITIMANYWATKNWEVTLLTLEDDIKAPGYELHPAIKHLAVTNNRPSRSSGILANPPSTEVVNRDSQFRVLVKDSFRHISILRENYRRLHRYLRHRRMLKLLGQMIQDSDPEVVISFIDAMNIMVLSETKNLDVPVIVSERTNPHFHDIGSKRLEKLRQRLYPRASNLVVQTQDAMSYFSPSIQKLTKIIPNPVLVPRRHKSKPINRDGGRVLVSLGRLSREKGYDLLLESFAKISTQHPTWRLEMWGEGPARPELEKLVKDLGLQERVNLPGLTRDPSNVFERADMFVMTSRYEGFPNALCEAMACGLPVVSFDCPSGPSEIIRHGVDGLLVTAEDVCELSSVLCRLMGDAVERNRLAAKAPEVSQRFNLDKVMGMWEHLISECRS